MVYFDYLLKSFYLILPAYFANMAPVIFDKLGLLKSMAKPIDGGLKLGQDFLFGQNKTWRGIISAVIFATLISGLQAVLYSYNFFNKISLIDYSENFLIFGGLAGLGAILGDLIKSFLKRRLHIASGKSWPIFDQLDFVIGFFIAVSLIYRPSIGIILASLLITLILHPLINLISYLLGLKRVWW